MDLQQALDRILLQHGPMLKRMGRGPVAQPWPCPHDQVKLDERDGAHVCHRCSHVVPA
jgi:hypothetical protein